MLKPGSRVLLVVALLSTGLGGACLPPSSVQLDVPLTAQVTDNWCWAASAQMVKNYVHPALNVQQCAEASAEVGLTCCAAAPTPDCDTRAWPKFEAPNFTAKDTWANGASSSPLLWDAIKNEIGCARRPFVFAWRDVGGSGHMMVATGYGRSHGVRYLWVNDPSPPNEGTFVGYSYNWYAGKATGAPSPWRDFYGIEYIGPE